MKVYVLMNSYDDTIEGIFTESSKAAEDKKLLNDAHTHRMEAIERVFAEITELKDMRQPLIDRSEDLLVEESNAKEPDSGGKFKLIRKERKQLIRQADQLTYKIQDRERLIVEYQTMLKADVLRTFGGHFHWEEYYLEGDI